MRGRMTMSALLLSAALVGPALAQAPGEPPPRGTYEQTLSHDAVRDVQRQLRSLGFYKGPVDGQWGRHTQDAVASFQQARRLQATGQLNPATVSAMGLDPQRLLAQGGGTGQPPGQVLAPGVVRTVQERLRRQGFYRGAIDGVWGGRTQAAVESFQKARGLQATGELNPTTISALGLNPNNLAAEAAAPPPAARSGSSLPPRDGAETLNRQELNALGR